MSKALDNNQSLYRMFRTTNDRGMPASVRGLAAGAAAAEVLGGASKAAVVSNGKDRPDDGNGNVDGGNDDGYEDNNQ